jgi:SMC interacting uncharacterized protein involved in chromosome segregation
MTIQERIFAQLSKNSKKKLSKQRVSLRAIKDDIDFYINSIQEPKQKAEQIVSDMERLGGEMQKILSEIQTLIPEAKATLELGYRHTEEIDDLIEKTKQGAELLGIDPSEIGRFTELEEIAEEDFFYFKIIEDAWWENINYYTSELSESEDLFK